MKGIAFRIRPIAGIMGGAALLSRKAKFLSLIFFAITVSLKGQDIQQINPQVPTSPQAEAFKQYGEYAINYSLGTVDISIPLYEINHRGYKLPLDLKYNPRPLKPGYNYDVYGHGWGLSVHSSVSRTIEGLPDEVRAFKIEVDKLNDGYYICPGCANACMPSPSPCTDSDLNHHDIANLNLSHDKFNVVLPNGTSFDFVIDFNDDTNTPVYSISSGRKVKISCSYTSENITSFIIIDEDGVKYTFSGSDTRHTLQESLWRNKYISWQLTRMDVPNKGPITFSYDHLIEGPLACTEPMIFINDYGFMQGTGNLTVHKAEVSSNVPAAVPYSYRMKLLSSITYGSTSIKLVYRDQNATAPYNYVDKIEIREHSTLLREIFLDKTISTLNAPHCRTGILLAKLDNVIIKGSDGSTDPQVYRCSYSSVGFFSGTDHWGYLNFGSTEYDVANFNLFVEFDTDHFSVFSSARISAVTKSPQDLSPYDKIKLSYHNTDNRQPGSPESHGVLTRLGYPTGGYTEFEFENHEFLTSTDNNGNYIYDRSNRRKAKAAGFRIKKIINHTSDTATARTLNYRYGEHLSATEHTGLGIAVVDPNILTYMNHSFYLPILPFQPTPGPSFIRNMILGLHYTGQRTSFANPFYSSVFDFQVWRWECNFSPLNFRRILNGRPPVLYSEVSVYYGSIDENTGKTVYRYNITEPGRDLLGIERSDVFFEAPRYFGNVISYIPKSYLYNQLKEKTEYASKCKSCYSAVKKEEYRWITREEESFRVNEPLEYININPYPNSLNPGYQLIGDQFTHTIILNGISLLDSLITSTYDPVGTAVTEIETYTYNYYNQLESSKIKTSDNKVIEKTFAYSGFFDSETSSAATQKMAEKNIISALLKTTTKVDGDLISGVKVDYNEFTIDDDNENTTDPKIIMPAKTYELELKPSGNEYVVKNQINRYTTNGNPLEFISSDGIHSSYLWDFNVRYLLLKADNIAYSDLSNIVAASLPPGAQFQPQLGKLSFIDWNAFNSNLRANLPDNAMVTTYTYTLAGKVSSITDPNNVTTYYSYDGFGRLTTVKDNDGNILNRTEYNLKE